MTQSPTIYGQPPAKQRPSAHPLAWVALAISVIALGVVGWAVFLRDPGVKPDAATKQFIDTVTSAKATEDAMPQCKALFVAGKVIDEKQAQIGCKDLGGGVQFIAGMNCGNGKHLYSVDGRTGAPAGWGYGGEKFHAVKGEIAADAGYGKAFHSCTG